MPRNNRTYRISDEAHAAIAQKAKEAGLSQAELIEGWAVGEVRADSPNPPLIGQWPVSKPIWQDSCHFQEPTKTFSAAPDSRKVSPPEKVTGAGPKGRSGAAEPNPEEIVIHRPFYEAAPTAKSVPKFPIGGYPIKPIDLPGKNDLSARRANAKPFTVAQQRHEVKE